MNRILTKLILAFAGCSLLATFLPLANGGGEALIPALGRDQSLLVYTGFLLLFFVWLAPPLFDGTEGRAGAMAGLTAILLVFAAIPLLFTAYISGVSAAGLLRLTALIAAIAGLPPLLMKLPGRRSAGGWMALLGSVFLFVLPGLVLYRQSVGIESSPWLAALSPWHRIEEIIARRQVPALWPYAAAAAAVWSPWLLSALRRRKPAPVAASCAFLAFLAGVSASGHPEASRPPALATELESLSGGRARPGFRTAIAVQRPGAEGEASVSSSVDSVLIQLRAGRGEAVLSVGPEDSTLRLASGAAEEVLPAPFTLAAGDAVLVAHLADPPSRRMTLEGGAPWAAGSAWIDADSASVLAHPGAYEAYDWMVVGGRTFDGLSAAVRDALLAYAALGGQLLLLGDSRDWDRACGDGRILSVAAGEPPPDHVWTSRWHRGSILDRDVVRTFAAPDWQEFNLRHLLVFTGVYHGVFLLAFLLPLLLDSRKSMGIYLVSVGFVTMLVALLAWHVLGRIFLRDNQVYTQSIALILCDGGPNERMVMRRFLSFASMSGETRDLELDGLGEAVVYGLSDADAPVLREVDGHRLLIHRVELDRYRGKRVVRIDSDAPRLISASVTEDSATVVLEDGRADPWGLRRCRLLDGVVIEGGRREARFEFDGGATGRRTPADAGAPEPGQDIMLRRLLGHFGRRHARYLLLRFEGLPRPDDGASYFWSRDLGAFAVVPL